MSFTLRTIETSGIEKNVFLGNEYTVIKYSESNNEFNKFIEDNDLDEPINSHAIVIDSSNQVYFISNNVNCYIVGSNGKTMSNLTYKPTN